MISADLVGCSTSRNKGTCDNRKDIRRDRLEARILNALRHHLMDPALLKEFCDEFTREMSRLRMAGRASIDAAQSEVKRLDPELDTLLIKSDPQRGGAADRINERWSALSAPKEGTRDIPGRRRGAATSPSPERGNAPSRPDRDLWRCFRVLRTPVSLGIPEPPFDHKPGW